MYQALGRRLAKVKQRSQFEAITVGLKIDQQIAKSGMVQIIVENRFKDQMTGPSKWAPLKQSTIKKRQRQGYGAGPILIRSGKLFKAATTGSVSVLPDKLVLHFKDGIGPVYPRGKIRKSKKARARPSRISTYAFSREIGYPGRKFYGPASETELRFIRHFQSTKINAAVTSIVNNQSPKV